MIVISWAFLNLMLLVVIDDGAFLLSLLFFASFLPLGDPKH